MRACESCAVELPHTELRSSHKPLLSGNTLDYGVVKGE